MPGFFEALENMPEPKKVVPKATIDGKLIEVSTELFAKIMKYGESQFKIEKGKVVMKPLPTKRTKYSTLQKGEKGFDLLQGEMYWPTEVIDGGFEWTR